MFMESKQANGANNKPILIPLIVVGLVAVLAIVVYILFPSAFGGVAGGGQNSSSSKNQSLIQVSPPVNSAPTKNDPALPTLPPPTSAVSNNSVSATNVGSKINKAELASKNTPENCWSSLNGSVYNVTEYISRHSGGEKSITRACGQDLAQFSANHPGGSFDSAKLQGILSEYKIGELEN
jgi:hypothetical protein